eukprot:7453220-Heterocapsa_arctica.AAC.1
MVARSPVHPCVSWKPATSVLLSSFPIRLILPRASERRPLTATNNAVVFHVAREMPRKMSEELAGIACLPSIEGGGGVRSRDPQATAAAMRCSVSFAPIPTKSRFSRLGTR